MILELKRKTNAEKNTLAYKAIDVQICLYAAEGNRLSHCVETDTFNFVYAGINSYLEQGLIRPMKVEELRRNHPEADTLLGSVEQYQQGKGISLLGWNGSVWSEKERSEDRILSAHSMIILPVYVARLLMSAHDRFNPSFRQMESQGTVRNVACGIRIVDWNIVPKNQ